jgi:hypothetical protein
MLALTGDNALHCAGMVTTKLDHQREHEGNRKTIAQGMPAWTGEPVVTYLRAFYFARGAAGAPKRPAFPAPSFFEGREIAKLGRNWRRENVLRCAERSTEK